MLAEIEPAHEVDLDALCALLATAELPTDGFAEHLSTALVTREHGRVVGCVALEPYGTLALLRSLAVTPSHRGQGLGRTLTSAVLNLARRRRIATVYLLTTTAADFFAKHFSFRPIARDAVPAAVRESVESVSACPATARAMVRAIRDGT